MNGVTGNLFCLLLPPPPPPPPPLSTLTLTQIEMLWSEITYRADEVFLGAEMGLDGTVTFHGLEEMLVAEVGEDAAGGAEADQRRECLVLQERDTLGGKCYSVTTRYRG